MIRLNAIAAPKKLTDKKAKELTQLYKQTGKAVWQKPYIKEALLALSHNKCCYCEDNVTEGSNYMEIEHFYPKSLYPDKVVDWTNLLPSCKRCNMAKGAHDVGTEAIINPVETTPSEHLSFQDYRLYGKTTLGTSTIRVVNLNHRNRLVTRRYKLSLLLEERLNSLLELTQRYATDESKSIQRKNRIIGTLAILMAEATPQFDYSATAATILLNDSSYQQIKMLFQQNDLWTVVFEGLEKQVQGCKLDLKND